MHENVKGGDVLLTGARQTMASWTKLIEYREELPDIYQSFFENHDLPHTLLLPSIVKPSGRTTEKLVYDSADAIHILERTGNQVFATRHPYRGVSMVEKGSILLNSWLTITGETGSSTLDFNTSGARHFEPFMEKFRPSPLPANRSQLNTEKDKFDYLNSLNFKLMNFGRNSLMSGEVVRQIVLQAEIKEASWAVLGGKFQKVITPAHLAVLTDCELILIQEVSPARKKQKDNYGGIWQYIRLDGIRSAECKEFEGRLIFSVTVAPDKKIEKLFAKENQEQVEKLCADLK